MSLVAAGTGCKKGKRTRDASKTMGKKTSLAPGSKVVTDYLDKSDLTKHLDAMGFHLVGYGCTTAALEIQDLYIRILLILLVKKT